jgi:hypothetical protein
MARKLPEKKTVVTEDEAEVSGNKVGGSCNVPGCPSDAETRGLCEAHWFTHRGLADEQKNPETGPEVAVP